MQNVPRSVNRLVHMYYIYYIYIYIQKRFARQVVESRFHPIQKLRLLKLLGSLHSEPNNFKSSNLVVGRNLNSSTCREAHGDRSWSVLAWCICTIYIIFIFIYKNASRQVVEPRFHPIQKLRLLKLLGSLRSEPNNFKSSNLVIGRNLNSSTCREAHRDRSWLVLH